MSRRADDQVERLERLRALEKERQALLSRERRDLMRVCLLASFAAPSEGAVALAVAAGVGEGRS